MSSPGKVFAIAKALVATSESQGIKADVSIITAVALASAVTSAGGLKTVKTLAVDAVEVAAAA